MSETSNKNQSINNIKTLKQMKKIILLFAVTLFSLVSVAQGKKALLIIAHGSKSSAWNQPVLNIENQVKTELQKQNITDFTQVKVALMEMSKPTIADVFRDFEKQGITNVFVIPLFIAPSGHSLSDVPTILGLSYNKNKYDETVKEGTEIVNTHIKITLGPTLDYDNIIKDILLDKVKALSKNPNNEALVILAHGDENFEPIWENLMDETQNYILSKTGIEYSDYAFVEVGQSFSTDGVSAILKAGEKKERVIVVGIYLSMGVKRMAETSAPLSMMGFSMDTKKLLEGKNIVFAQDGLLPDVRITKWIVNRTVEWLNK